MRNIIYQDTKIQHTINNETGEIKETNTTMNVRKRVPKEPDFIKLYLQDICKLKSIPKTGSSLLNELLKYTSYDNTILIPSYVKQEIAKNLNTSVGTISNALTTLVKKGILKRKGGGAYALDPFLFGKGKWEDIRKIRMTWEYSEDGKNLDNVDIASLED